MTFNKPQLEEGSSLTNAMFSDEYDEKKLADTSDPIEEVKLVTNTVIEESTEVESEDLNDDDIDDETLLEETEDDDVPSEYELAANDLFKKGLIVELPKGITDIPDLATYNKVLLYNRKKLDDKLVEDVYKDLDTKLSPIARQIVSFDLDSKEAGGDVTDFIKSLLFTVDTTNLDVENPIDQEEIIYQYLSSKNMSEEEINDMIETLKENPDKLKKQATKYKPELVEIAKKEAEKHIYEQNLIEAEEKDKREFLSNKLTEQLQTGKLGKISENSDEIPLSKEDAQWLLNAGLDAKVDAKVKGKKVQMEMMEALTYYHKYHKDGNINLYMTALLLMKDPEKVIEHFKKIAKKEVIKDVRSDNSFGNSGLTFTRRKQEIIKPAQGKKAYSLEALS